MTKYNKYKVLIIVCWILLFICCVVKLVGFNIFIASTEHKSIIKICSFIDSRFWLQCTVLAISNLISCGIYYMTVLKENKLTLNSLKWLLPLIPYIILKQIFYKQVIIFFITDIFMMILLPVIINKKCWYWAILSFLFVLVFELISAFLKMNHYKRFDDNTLIYLLLSLDYYIMLVLYYLYRVKFFKKGDENI